jgi:molybdopterin-guanine dinucleotide biosynthesis protein A
MKRHGSGVRYVRELVSRKVRPKGVSSRYFERIASGVVEKISHAAYKKFRNEYSRLVYAIFTSHNVKPVVVKYSSTGNRYRTRAPTRGLSLDEIEYAAEQTDFGRTWEHASNDVVTWKEELIEETAEEEKIEPEEVEIDVEDLEEEHGYELENLRRDYNRMARIIVHNNGLFETWKKEGRRFINKDKRVSTMKASVEHMKEIMALGFRDYEEWDEYIEERHNVEQWKPVVFVYDKNARRTVREFVPEGNPKYAEWQRRLASGKIIKP